MKQQRNLHMFLFASPFILLIAWVISLEWDLSRARRLELGIRAYDPRDLLSGHYLRYQLDLGQHDPCGAEKAQLSAHDEPICVCWEQGTEPAGIFWAGACQAKPKACSFYLRGQCRSNRFEAGLERFYVPEADTPYLQRVPERSRLVLKVTDDGRGFVQELKPAGLSYQQWLQEQR